MKKITRTTCVIDIGTTAKILGIDDSNFKDYRLVPFRGNNTSGKRSKIQRSHEAGQLDQLSVDKDGVIHNVDAKKRKTNNKKTKTRLPRTNGRWDGKPGESLWFSDNSDVKSIVGNEGCKKI